MDTPSILPILQKIPLFAELNETEHKEIIKNIMMNFMPAGHVFFHEDDADQNGMYIIKHGMVKITRKNKQYDTDEEIAVLNDNDFFGEMSLVTSEPRNATATAIAETEVFQLSKGDFVKLVESSPALANKISTKYQERVKQDKLSPPRL